MPNPHTGKITKHGVGRNPIQKVTVIEATWSELPDDAYDDIRKAWSDFELGNYSYYLDWSFTEDTRGDYPALAKFIKDNKIEGKILLHYWW